MLVFNKIDLIKETSQFVKINNEYNSPLMISTIKKLRVNLLIDKISKFIVNKNPIYKMTVNFNNTILIKEIYRIVSIIKEESDSKSITFTFTANKKDYKQIQNIRKSSFSEDL